MRQAEHSQRKSDRGRVFYNLTVKTHDAIVIGAGVIGLSLALALRKRGLSVLVIERGEPGREASHAAAGMLVRTASEFPPPLQPLAAASAGLYPEFVRELQDESNLRIDFREQGTVLISARNDFPHPARLIALEELAALELELRSAVAGLFTAFVSESSVDPRTLMHALIQAAKNRGADIASGSQAESVLIENGRATGVRTNKTSYPSDIVVNCTGAWAGQLPPYTLPVRPVKGQMLAVVGGPDLKHVVRTDDVYLVPRSDGRIVIGSTLEDAGFNKQTEVDTIERLLRSAARFVPALSNARQHEAWAGLRPGTPDNLPVLGATPTPGYFLATGHYRDGILLAPVTAAALAALICETPCAYDLAPFNCSRFSMLPA